MHLVGVRSGSLELFGRAHQTTQSVNGLKIIRGGHVVGVRKNNGGRAFHTERPYHFCTEALEFLAAVIDGQMFGIKFRLRYMKYAASSA
jgi:hypothetical protein